MRMIKTYNFILKTEIVDKCRETIMNENKKKQMEYMTVSY